MPEGSGGQRPQRSRPPGGTRRGTSRPARTPTPAGRGAAVRERLRRDPFLFVLCLGALAFITWAFALTWWVTGGLVPLALALASIAPALLLFYLRDA
jgi:hypothetical protein